MNNKLFFQSNYEKFSVIVCEEDIGAIYAYLIYDKNIISDVWLFNVIQSPFEAPWKIEKNPPFLNSEIYSIEKELKQSDFNNENYKIEFFVSTDYGICANIILYDKLIAIISEKVKPGWSYYAKINGPLAKMLESFNGY